MVEIETTMSIYNLDKAIYDTKGLILGKTNSEYTSEIFRYYQSTLVENVTLYEISEEEVGSCDLLLVRIGKFVICQIAGINFTTGTTETNFIRTQVGVIPNGFRSDDYNETLLQRTWFSEVNSSTNDLRPNLTYRDNGDGAQLSFELNANASFATETEYEIGGACDIISVVWIANDDEN